MAIIDMGEHSHRRCLLVLRDPDTRGERSRPALTRIGCTEHPESSTCETLTQYKFRKPRLCTAEAYIPLVNAESLKIGVDVGLCAVEGGFSRRNAVDS